MPQRLFLSETWSGDRWFLKLEPNQKLLFIYLWSNDHVNQAGVYHLPIQTMAFETGFSEDEIHQILPSLSPKIEWIPEEDIIWVRNFIKHQAKSPKFLVAAAKCLKTIKNNGLVKEVIDFNWREHRVSIPYEYPTDRVSVGYGYRSGPDSDTDTDTDTDKGRGGAKGTKKQSQKQTDPRVNEILGEMRAYLGYRDKTDKDPIPSYGKEGQAIKRMLNRGFTREEVTDCWKRKVDARGGEFVSMTWVNEDIGKKGGKGGTDKRHPGEGKPKPKWDPSKPLRSD